MAHSLELLLDPAGDAVIRSAWRALDAAGLPSQSHVTSPTNRPHVTLLAAQRISPEVDDVLRPLAGRFPLPCVLGAPLVFGGARQTLARLVVPSADLLALHDEVYRRAVPYVIGEPFTHCRPGQWTPHATLGRRFSAAEIGAAIAVLQPAGADGSADLVGLRRWDSDRRVDQILVG